MKIFARWLLLPLLLLVAGCGVTTREVAPDEKVIYDEGYHFSDKKAIVANMVKSLISKHTLVRGTDRPVL